ncbi:hypothetical protein BJ165DRAFT_218090 [Panaeolus papilionaceus]|nr:hypothetical protein BJ165DRAFT_218090 [Panaeolus papilionaceus]
MRNLLGCLPILEERLAFGLLHRTWITSASLVILVWDYFLCLDNELGYIWRRPFTLSRGYIPLIVQSINVYLVNGPLRFNIPIKDPRPCFRWWYFLLASLTVLLQGLDSLLMLRIYAHYKKDRRIAVLFISLLASMAICRRVTTVIFVRNFSFNCTCDTINVYSPIIWLGVVIWVVQISIGMLLFSRRSLRSIRSRVVKIVNRDGVIILGLICGTCSKI